ncbi:hypothetical protein WJX81_002452 [Elliptochloris bilobata]|uniref:Uncharacterized protein n=1 Tax=Elliptochloris bilobata TaxID=381761 RepID=A0AAW1RZL7_9CHLO
MAGLVLKESNWDDKFPAGLRVLVVDDDPLCLKVVEHMLKRCKYAVTTCPNGLAALDKLRDRSDHFDLVLSDVYMPDMDGFKLLEHIGLELGLPVIMMSSNGEENVVLQGVTHGAVDFLIKPGSGHSQDVRETSDEEVNDDKRGGSEKKRKERRDSDDGATQKKPRVVWSAEMHQQFVEAVERLGVDKAVPKRILDAMNVVGLTRENVASHLQKYRQGLAKIQGMDGAGRGGRGGSRCSAYPAMMGCVGGVGNIAMNPGLAAQLSTPVGQREYLNSQLQQMNGMNGVPPGLAVLGLPPNAMGGSADYLGGLGGGMQVGLGGLPGGAVGLPPGSAALPAMGSGVPGMLGGGLGAAPQYGAVPLSVGRGGLGDATDAIMMYGHPQRYPAAAPMQVRARELGHFGADADVGDLLQFPQQALLPLGQGHQPDLVPGLAGVQLGGQAVGHHALGTANTLNGGALHGHSGVEVKSEGMDAMLEMFLRE